MSDVKENLLYSESHEWLSCDNDIVTVGLSDHAQTALGDVVYVELPEVGKTVAKQEDIALVESVKAASDVYTPVSGEVVEVNEALEAEPQIINESCYDKGWLFKIKLAEPSELESLMSADTYAKQCESE